MAVYANAKNNTEATMASSTTGISIFRFFLLKSLLLGIGDILYLFLPQAPLLVVMH